MPDAASALKQIANVRTADTLAPVTVLVPSHTAGLQMRRRLAEYGAFAAVRFETLPRIAELLGAGSLAAAQRRPLARPIGDYVAEQVARESRGALEPIGDLPGYARALRHIFRRLRRGGIATGEEDTGSHPGHFREILRLYSLYRQRTAAFYDDEDLLDAAADAVRSGRAGALADLGTLYVVPPGPLTASGAALLEALRKAVPACHDIDDPEPRADTRFVLAPDPASEAREVVRGVIDALENGMALDEIAVFHGAGGDYGRLLREAFAVANVPCVPTPGVPLIESRAGRGVMLLARLTEQDFARTAVIDFLTVAPLRDFLPTGGGSVRNMSTVWDRLSREAGISRSARQWTGRLQSLINDRDTSAAYQRQQDEENRALAAELERDETRRLLNVVTELIHRLEPLRAPQCAGTFIEAMRRIVNDYFAPDVPAMDPVIDEIDQLGTVDAVDGDFSLASFAEALDVNLQAAVHRPATLGSGVLVGDYRQAAGLQFKHVVLCGAFEGALPAGPGIDNLLDDRVWRGLKERFPHIEDTQTRIERAQQAARRAVYSAGDGTLVWSCPRYEPGGTREYYPSHVMVKAVSDSLNGAGERITASSLRGGLSAHAIRHALSPMTGALLGPPVDAVEGAMRRAVHLWHGGGRIPDDHPRRPALSMLRSRRSNAFTEFDGNLLALQDDAWLELQRAISPTHLEKYAVCGFRYFCGTLLRLNTVEEPEEREMMDPLARGSLIHEVLDRFFKQQKERGRPAQYEPWNDDDEQLLLDILEEELAEAAGRGLTGLDVYGEHDARTIRADLLLFLRKDNEFRRHTGAIPSDFEIHIPETEVAGVTLRGVVDRIDRTPDGSEAWIIDYKTGSARSFETITETDPLAGGTKLQLPVYLAAAADAERARAIYWFITRKGDFKQIPYEPSPERDARFRKTIEAIVGGVRAGSFPPVPGEDNEFYRSFENCAFCEFDRICSRRRDHEFAAKEDDANIAPWHAVRLAASPEAEGAE